MNNFKVYLSSIGKHNVQGIFFFPIGDCCKNDPFCNLFPSSIKSTTPPLQIIVAKIFHEKLGKPRISEAHFKNVPTPEYVLHARINLSAGRMLQFAFYCGHPFRKRGIETNPVSRFAAYLCISCQSTKSSFEIYPRVVGAW